MGQVERRGEAAPPALGDLQSRPCDASELARARPPAAPARAVAQHGSLVWLDAATAQAAVTERALALLEGELFTAATESLYRRRADRELLDSLAQLGWQGPEFEVFRGDLVTYGFPVLMDWLYTGKIFDLCARKGRALTVTDTCREVLRHSKDERAELAYETLALGLQLFCRRALIEGMWNVDGGANVKTFFVGALLLAFPTPYRRWARDQAHWAAHLVHRDPSDFGDELSGRPASDLLDADPADIVITRQGTAALLAAIKDPITREVGRLILADLSHVDIGRRLGLTDDAVNMRLYRLRQSLRRRPTPALRRRHR